MGMYAKQYGQAYSGLGNAMRSSMTPTQRPVRQMSEDEMQRNALLRALSQAAPGVLGAVGTVAGGVLGGTAGSIVPGAGTVAGAGLGAGLGGAAGAGLGSLLGGAGEAYVNNQEIPYQRSAAMEMGRRDDENQRRQAMMAQIAMLQGLARR